MYFRCTQYIGKGRNKEAKIDGSNRKSFTARRDLSVGSHFSTSTRDVDLRIKSSFRGFLSKAMCVKKIKIMRRRRSVKADCTGGCTLVNSESSKKRCTVFSAFAPRRNPLPNLLAMRLGIDRMPQNSSHFVNLPLRLSPNTKGRMHPYTPDVP